MEAGERERLLLALPPNYRVLHWVAMYTGLRLGELYGLRWSDVELDAKRLNVRQQYQDGIFDTPKSASSVRVVSLDDRTVEKLRRWRAVAPKGEYDLVVTTSKGTPLHKSNVNRRVFKPALKAAELPPEVRFHDLRHTCASMALAEGVPMADLSKMLGHSSITVTVDIYGHLMEQGHDRMRSAIGRQIESMSDAIDKPVQLFRT